MMTEVINMYSFFEMMAEEIVDSPEEADVILTDKTMELPKSEDHQPEIIREYDSEKTLALLNKCA